MLVPRSYKYRAPPPPPQQQQQQTSSDNMRNKSTRHTVRQPTVPAPRSMPLRDTSPPYRPNTQPVAIPPPRQSKAAAVEEHGITANRSHMASRKSATVGASSGKRTAHDPNALPPAVAALLAMTTIPPRRPNRYRTTPDHARPVSIEELVSSWKIEDGLESKYGSPGLSMLLEDTEEPVDSLESGQDASVENYRLNLRSSSSESMPSLEADDRSVHSFGSLSTPESLMSRKSFTNLRRDKSRNPLAVEDCPEDHPLIPQLGEAEDEEDFIHLPVPKQPAESRKFRSSFKSNLTVSLQSLKNAALNSISSFGRTTTSASPQFQQHRPGAPAFDEALWSHPFLFPSFSSEVRPALDGSKVSKAQRRYLNPTPLTFEEQEAPFQRALHAPYLKESLTADGLHSDDSHNGSTTIQMQTYIRGQRRKGGSSRRTAPDPNSEAGRALLGADRIRQREVRENSDFLRIVVMEMNMRRVGKLESGRAKIWLPPRDSSPPAPQTRTHETTPSRWVGISAY